MPGASQTTIVRTTAQVADNSIEQADLGDDAVGLPEIKAGTAGTILAWDASGNPVEVPAGTAGQLLKSNGADTPSWTSGTDLSATAGEALTAGQPVYIADGSETAVNEIDQSSSGSNLGSYFNAAANWIMQSFVCPASPTFVQMTAFKAYLGKTGTPTGSIVLNIYADNGSDRKTGSSLATSSVTYASIATGPGLITFTLATPLVLTPGVKYIAEFDPGSGVSGANRCEFHATVNSVISGTIANSGDSGSTYTNGATADGVNNGGDMRFQLVCGPVAGKMYRTDASDASWTHNFVGFVRSTVAADASATAQIVGVVTGLSGLTPGSEYYLSDTVGTIASSAGSTSKKVGLALTATTLLIKNAPL